MSNSTPIYDGDPVRDLAEKIDKAAIDPLKKQWAAGNSGHTTYIPPSYTMPLDYYQNLMTVMQAAMSQHVTFTINGGTPVARSEASLLALYGCECHYSLPHDEHQFTGYRPWPHAVANYVDPARIRDAELVVKGLLSNPGTRQLGPNQAVPYYPPGTTIPYPPPPTSGPVNRAPDPCDPQWTPDQITQALDRGAVPVGCTCAAHWKAFRKHATLCPLGKG